MGGEHSGDDLGCVTLALPTGAKPLGAKSRALLSRPATSVVREVSGGHPLSEFGRLRPLLERRG